MKKKLIFQISAFVSTLIGLILSCQIYAQEILPSGGSSFETAIPTSLGEYQGGELKDGEDDWYYLINNSIQPGQELQIQIFFVGNTSISTTAYDQNRQKLVGKEFQRENETNTTYWLNGANKQEKFYIRFSNQAIFPAVFKNIDIKLIDRFDASSQTDAGASFETALSIESGQSQGFLAIEEGGNDEKDFYQISVKRGQNLTVKATPPTDISLELTIYDQNRNELFNDYSQNKGALVSGSVKALKNGTFYIAVAPAESYYDREAIKYTLDVSGATLDQSQSGMANPEEEITEPKIGLSVKDISKSLGFILLIIATVLIIIIVTVFFLLKNKSPQREEPEKEKVSTKTKTPIITECSKCGTQNPDNSRFCSKCGEKLI